MTTLAAALGALPLAIGFGEGAELRRPLGVAIIGGLIASQLLTLLTTPVVYVLLDKLRAQRKRAHERRRSGAARLAEADAVTSAAAAARLIARTGGWRVALAGLRRRPRLRSGRPRRCPRPTRKRPPPPARPGCRPRRPTRSTRGDWWRLFGDAELNRLAAQIEVVNQNVAAAVAVVSRRRRRSCARRARRAFPPLGARRRARAAPAAAAQRRPATPSPSRSAPTGRPTSGAGSAAASRARSASAQASAADLAAARLSAQGELAINYFSLREADAELGPARARRSKATSARCRSRRTAMPPASRQDRRAAGRRRSSPRPAPTSPRCAPTGRASSMRSRC